MKNNRLIWLPSALLLGIVALSSIFSACYIFFSVSGFRWSSIAEQFILGLSEPSFRGVIIVPVVIGIIMLIGMMINIKIAGDLKRVNKLFFVLLIAITISILFKNVFGSGMAIVVIVAWLLQRHETRRVHNNGIETDAE